MARVLLLGFCLSLSAALGLVPNLAGAATEFSVPALTGPVVDDAGALSPRTEQALTQALRALHEKGGSQINVLMLSSLEGTPIEQASIRIVDQWKLGGRKTDNGVLLLVAVKDRKLRIEVGQGLEGQLTDADSKRIIDQGIVPLLRSGDLDSAVVVGVFQIAQKTDPEFDLTPFLEGKARAQRHSPNGIPLRGWVLVVIVILFFILGGGSRGRRGFYGGGGWGGGGGGFGGGGFGGGTWGGGGGGFSGGGASGDW